MSGVAADPGRALADAWARAWMGRDSRSFSDLCTPDVHYEDPVARRPVNGPEAVAEHAARLWSAFPYDLEVRRTGTAVVQGLFACLPWRASGTNGGPLDGLPATHRRATIHGVHYVELSDGLVRRARGFFDLYHAGVQLGLMAERGSLPERALLLLKGFGLRPRG
jgi:steroid delta-isomerase-like uncharacterized protein